MKIIIDKNIPFIDGVLEPFAEVKYLDGKAFTKKEIGDAQALIIRTRTHCDKDLLDGSNVKIIVTATIGTDHIDAVYCKENGIKIVSAAGCNANAVCQWVNAALSQISANGITIKGKTLGIIGVGNVGSKVEILAKTLGINTLLCDPFKIGTQYISQKQLLEQADIITLHTPYTNSGQHPTAAMANAEFFSKMKKGAAFFNASRGEVVDDQALISAIKSSKLSFTAIDVWNNEPIINTELLDLVTIATPHIAGYSMQGKANATAMSVKAVSDFFKLGINNWYPNVPAPNGAKYDIMSDDRSLRDNILDFENLRNTYAYRLE